MPEDRDLLSLFNFEVHLGVSGFGGDEGLIADPRGAFSEVSGLEFNVEHTEIREGGYNRGSRQLVGKTTHPVLVLKRGVSLDGAFWDWIQRCVEGTYPLPYINGSVLVYPPSGDRGRDMPAIWTFINGIATSVKSADLNAGGATAVPIEELHIAHEGLERFRPTGPGEGARG
jgi:phage tail-like protein